ncbi:PadR family transcriptional regulator [Nonomuraea sp. H19]|uniref:PadR family transcriptional regulator n=1 Tax=Nonomuraea sp. H19 TaxID=3452206 RepID=UPI003F88FF10
MARRDQTEMAVLGALSMQPMTAYALREAIREVLGHFWSESFGQIYPTLNALEGEGHVQRQEGPRAGSSIFTITGSGAARLRDLLNEPVKSVPPRNGLLLRLFFGRHLGAGKCRELLQDAKADAERRLRDYDALARTVAEEDRDSPDLPYALLTVSAGRHSAEAAVAWADEALALLDTLPETVHDTPLENGEPR